MIPPPHISPRPQTPRHYLCFRAPAPLSIDGDLSKPVWQAAPWTDEFLDIEGDARPRPRHRTRAKMLWDDEFFYIAAEMDEPHLWGTLTQHDSIVYHDNDFEVFLNPTGDNHNYYELEINALATIFDLWLPKPYRDGGPADHDWNVVALKKAVQLRGTLNDPRDTDQGWTVELAFPWRAFDRHSISPSLREGVGGWVPNASDSPATPITANRAPRNLDHWRLNFSRVQWDLEVIDGQYRKVPNRPEHNWVWSPQGLIDMHRPEMWGYVQFSDAAVGTDAARAVRFRPDPTASARALLHAIYYAQARFRHEHQRWAGTLAELAPAIDAHHVPLVHDQRANIRLTTTPDGWEAFAPVEPARDAPDPAAVSIRHDSLVRLHSAW